MPHANIMTSLIQVDVSVPTTATASAATNRLIIAFWLMASTTLSGRPCSEELSRDVLVKNHSYSG